MGKNFPSPKKNYIKTVNERGCGPKSVLYGPVRISRIGIRVHLGSRLNRALVGDEKSIRAISKTNRFTVQEVFQSKSKKVPEKK